MKHLATIGAVALFLFTAAVYLSSQKSTSTQGTPEPSIIPSSPALMRTNYPTTSGRVDGVLTLNSAISNGYLAVGSAQDLYATIDIDAKKFKNKNRPALNIALVIDRSGSMSGDKMEKAKAAARRLVNSLNENDRVAIVSYGSDVSVDFSSRLIGIESRPEILQAINRILIGGGTNLSGGFQRGLSEVRAYVKSFSVNRVILMSDGKANIGITYEPELVKLAKMSLRESVSVTTMGVGLDYNEDLMTAMANEGAGNYYFVNHAEEIVSLLDKELKGLASTVASHTSVIVTLKDGVKLSKLYGFPHEVEGNQIIIPLSEFYSEQKKTILMKLNVGSKSKGALAIYDLKLRYNDLTQGSQNIELKSAALSFQTIITNDASKVASQVNVDVISRVQQIEIAQSLQDAMQAYESGDSGRATEIVQNSRKTLKERRKKYKFKSPKKYDREDANLGMLENEFKTTAPSSRKAKTLRKRQKAKSNIMVFDGF